MALPINQAMPKPVSKTPNAVLRLLALTRDDTTIVIRDVPALICTICGEEYVDAATGRRLSEIAEKAVHEGVQVDVRRYQAA